MGMIQSTSKRTVENPVRLFPRVGLESFNAITKTWSFPGWRSYKAIRPSSLSSYPSFLREYFVTLISLFWFCCVFCLLVVLIWLLVLVRWLAGKLASWDYLNKYLSVNYHLLQSICVQILTWPAFLVSKIQSPKVKKVHMT